MEKTSKNSQDGMFKWPEFKITPTKELDKKFKLFYKLAKFLQLYDDRFPDEQQGGGFHRFKQMCFDITLQLPESANPHIHPSHQYVLSSLHVMIRPKALVLAKHFRENKSLKEMKEALMYL